MTQTLGHGVLLFAPERRIACSDKLWSFLYKRVAFFPLSFCLYGARVCTKHSNLGVNHTISGNHLGAKRLQDYWDWRPRNRGSIPDKVRDFSLLQSIQIGFRAHPVSYSMGTGERGLFPREYNIRAVKRIYVTALTTTRVLTPVLQCPHGMHGHSFT